MGKFKIGWDRLKMKRGENKTGRNKKKKPVYSNFPEQLRENIPSDVTVLIKPRWL